MRSTTGLEVRQHPLPGAKIDAGEVSWQPHEFRADLRKSTPNVLKVITLERQCLRRVCAVTRRRFPVCASLARQTLQPEAIGAVMEATKWLKPSIIPPSPV